ncbi:MAG: hypothetical protein ABIA97_05530 [Candidatus Omnitrophota bacterium]
MAKEKYIQLRVGKEEKRKLKQRAKKNGFDTLSAYILWLLRKSSK